MSDFALVTDGPGPLAMLSGPMPATECSSLKAKEAADLTLKKQPSRYGHNMSTRAMAQQPGPAVRFKALMTFVSLDLQKLISGKDMEVSLFFSTNSGSFQGFCSCTRPR